jgi:tetratricopeptide (TPR) repeat protein
MIRLATIITALGLMSCASAYGWRSPFRDLPSGINADAAKTAEQKGDVARVRNNYAAAAAFYQQALRTSARDPQLYIKLGIAQLKQGQTGSARKSFLQAVKYDPRNGNALNNIGAVYCLEKKYKPALRYLRQALEIDESNAGYHVNMGEAWAGMSQIDRAMTEYARALELDPDIFSSDGAGVVAQVRSPEQRARMDYLIAKLYARKGNLDGALDYLSRAKQSHYPQLADVYVDKEFAALWQDPRLEKIIKQQKY